MTAAQLEIVGMAARVGAPSRLIVETRLRNTGSAPALEVRFGQSLVFAPAHGARGVAVPAEDLVFSELAPGRTRVIEQTFDLEALAGGVLERAVLQVEFRLAYDTPSGERRFLHERAAVSLQTTRANGV